MYTACYQSEEYVWRQNLICVTAVFEDVTQNPAHDLLENAMQKVIANPHLHWAVRWSLDKEKFSRVLMLQYQKEMQNDMAAFIEHLSRLNALSEHTVIAPNHRDEHNRILNDFSAYTCWIQPVIYEWNALKFITHFRISRYFSELILHAIDTGIRVDYQINARPYSFPVEATRSIRKQMLRLEEANLPEKLKQYEIATLHAALSGNVLVEEFLATDSAQGVTLLREFLGQVYETAFKNYGFFTPDFTFSESAEYGELIHVGLHSSLSIHPADLEAAAMSAQAKEAISVFHLEAAYPKLCALFTNTVRKVQPAEASLVGNVSGNVIIVQAGGDIHGDVVAGDKLTSASQSAGTDEE